MHELALAQSVLEHVCREAGGARVVRVVLEVGTLAAVVPEALTFAFECASRGTSAEGAELVLESVTGRGRCRVCGQDCVLETAWTRCGCGSLAVEWLSGDQLVVRSMEVTRCAERADAKVT